MLLKRWFQAVLLASVAVVTPLTASPIPIYGTGVGDTLLLLPGGSVDPHYHLVVSPDSTYTGPAAQVVQDGYPVGSGIWVDNGPNSKWIAPRSDAASGNSEGDYVFETTFSLDGLDPETAVLSGAWATDNAGLEILLNGVPTGNSIGFGTPGDYSFQHLTAFTISSGFVAGINRLSFRLNNFPNGGVNPAGLRVDLSGTAEPAASPIPEPASAILLGVGGLLAVLVRIRGR